MGALLGRLRGAGEVHRGERHRQMREGLREVADLAAEGRIVLLRQQPDIVARFEAMGMGMLVTPTPEDFAALLKSETTRWQKVIASAGVKPE